MLGITTMKLFQAWVRENAATNEIAAYNSQLLIVGMSATALESEQEAAFDYGMHFFCPKPANMDILGLMLDAKRKCSTNEEALDMICAATGTDYHTEAPMELLNADMAEGDEAAEEEFGDLRPTLSGLPSVAVSHEASFRADWVDTSAMSTGHTDPAGAMDGETSNKASSKGSGKGSEKAKPSGPENESSLGISAAHSAVSLTSSGAGGGGGGGTGSATSSAVGGPGKAVTDSKSAAMWSVFRSYRQSTRSVPPAAGPPAIAAVNSGSGKGSDGPGVDV